VRGRGQVEVLRRAVRQQVAHAAAAEVGAVAAAVQAVQHLEHVLRDAPARDRVRVAVDDDGVGGFRSRLLLVSGRCVCLVGHGASSLSGVLRSGEKWYLLSTMKNVLSQRVPGKKWMTTSRSSLTFAAVVASGFGGG